MAARFGAHEIMQMHEVLSNTIDGINHLQLYRPHVKDQQLLGILDKQIQFLTQEYNNMVQAINQRGFGHAIPYRSPRSANPTYGLRSPGSQTPNTSANEMDDRDVASAMLGCHKASASMRMIAALECADPQLRRMVQQSAINSSEQAYEVWQFMNQKGFYQVPTMKDETTNTLIGTYTAATTGQPAQYQL